MKNLTAEKCREQFEDWMTSLPGLELADVERRYDGKYSYSETEWCWKSWQASRQALEIALPILEQQERGDGDWIDWGGGQCPVADDQRVHVQFRDGEVINTASGNCIRWSHKGTSRHIIAYRIIPEQIIEEDGSTK